MRSHLLHKTLEGIRLDNMDNTDIRVIHYKSSRLFEEIAFLLLKDCPGYGLAVVDIGDSVCHDINPFEIMLNKYVIQ